MNTPKNFNDTRNVLYSALGLVVLLSLLAVFYQAKQLASSQPPVADAAKIVEAQGAAVAPSRGAELPETGNLPAEAVAMKALWMQSTAKTTSLTKVYHQPAPGSQVDSVLTPGQAVRILGRSADGTYFAIGGDKDGQKVMGWVATMDLAHEAASTRTHSLAKLYRQPDANSAIAMVLSPNQTINLMGTSPDGAWYAVAGSGYEQKLAGWVSKTDLQMAAPLGEMISVTKTHLRADESSQVFDVLTPAQKVTLFGRSPDDAWIALGNPDGSHFRGWARAREVRTTADLKLLPLLPTR